MVSFLLYLFYIVKKRIRFLRRCMKKLQNYKETIETSQKF